MSNQLCGEFGDGQSGTLCIKGSFTTSTGRKMTLRGYDRGEPCIGGFPYTSIGKLMIGESVPQLNSKDGVDSTHFYKLKITEDVECAFKASNSSGVHIHFLLDAINQIGGELLLKNDIINPENPTAGSVVVQIKDLTLPDRQTLLSLKKSDPLISLKVLNSEIQTNAKGNFDRVPGQVSFWKNQSEKIGGGLIFIANQNSS